MTLKKCLTGILGVLLFSSCTPKEDPAFRVMTWNIWHGGLHGTPEDDFKKDSVNPINIFKVLKRESPDILFMQETYCCGMEMAKQAGYPYSWRGSSNLSIHSKYPITDTLAFFKPFNSHGAVIAVNDKKILCVNLWLNWRPDYFTNFDTLSIDSMIAGEKATRLKEIKSILNSVDSLEKKLNLPIILGGDFNSSSHLDWVERTQKFHFNKVIPWPVTRFMEESGYTDSFREANPDPGTSLEGTWGFHNRESALLSDRIDYIFYKGGGLEVVDSRIVKDNPPGGFFNSDHRAIVTEFEWRD
ncbi:MAG: endonuclease/exonuclease/phosphatase family protein [Bacteroidota bacterium]